MFGWGGVYAAGDGLGSKGRLSAMDMETRCLYQPKHDGVWGVIVTWVCDPGPNTGPVRVGQCASAKASRAQNMIRKSNLDVLPD